MGLTQVDILIIVEGSDLDLINYLFDKYKNQCILDNLVPHAEIQKYKTIKAK